MAATSGWSSPAGLRDLKTLLTRLLRHQWPQGPHDWQVETTARILDGTDQFVVVACGGGKTAVSYLPILVLKELARDISLPRYGIEVPADPIVLFIGPLSDLSVIQVSSMYRIVTARNSAHLDLEVAEMGKMGVKAVTLESGTVRNMREREGRDLWKEVIECEHSIVILSPERLTHPNLGEILRSDRFRRNLVALLLDEAHLIVPWGVEFRKSYGEIPRLRARIPNKVPCAAVTATSRPGKNETKLFDQLSFRHGSFKQTRQSNERTNIYKAYQTLTHGLSGPLFPDIAWVSKHKEKTIIYCRQMKICALVADYLRAFLPPGPERDHCIRQYHSLLPQDRNLDTLHAFETDPDVFCVVATIKFGMGLDARRVKFVVILGLPTTVETAKQEEGRVARDQSMDGMAITYVEMSVVAGIQDEIKKKNKEKQVRTLAQGHQDVMGESEDVSRVEVYEEDEDENLSDVDADVGNKKKAKRTVDSQSLRMVRCHVMGACLVAEDNRIFGNQGPLAHLNCIEASRRLRCSSCLSSTRTPPPAIRSTRRRRKPKMSSALQLSIDLDDTNSSSSNVRRSSKYKPLTKKMKAYAATQLWIFARKRWRSKDGAKYRYLPSVSFFPDNILVHLLAAFHFIRNHKMLTEVLAHWTYLESDGHALFGIVNKLNAQFDIQHEKTLQEALEKRKATLAQKKIEAAGAKAVDQPLAMNSDLAMSDLNNAAQPIAPQLESCSRAAGLGVENTPPNTPRKPKKRAAGSNSEHSRKRRRKA
ncbi:hypothetical protein NLI96_g4816 [Meripilus lineatus]|uniref:DNA 3'-5' helicase n=1 Tax=Meripilus lineatus TaxID=2056292 RepID=A0AAD5YHK5_9APHY|nr:hypothetical protein NLI96_g4816 [Physisporinus lineatus]